MKTFFPSRLGMDNKKKEGTAFYQASKWKRKIPANEQKFRLAKSLRFHITPGTAGDFIHQPGKMNKHRKKLLEYIFCNFYEQHLISEHFSLFGQIKKNNY